MGKTRARRGRDRGMSNEALIKIIGAQSILPRPFTAVARKDQSWYAFLAENGLQLTPADGIYIRTSHMRDLSRNRNNEWHGFSGELNEKVATFLNNYKMNRKQYTVRLMRRQALIKCKPKQAAKKGVRGPRQRQGEQKRRSRMSTGGSRFVWGPWSQRSVLWEAGKGAGRAVATREARLASRRLKEREEAVEEEMASGSGQLGLQAVKLEMEEEEIGSGGLGLQAVKLELEEVQINNVASGSGGAEDEVPQQQEVVEGGEEEEDFEDDNMSGVTSASQEEVDLRRRGIRSEDLVNPARGRFNKFENGFLLRARQELKKLKERNLWTRNYQRAPLASYLLEEILKP